MPAMARAVAAGWTLAAVGGGRPAWAGWARGHPPPRHAPLAGARFRAPQAL